LVVVDKLRAEKLLTREQSKNDWRKQETRLTKNGAAFTQRLAQHALANEVIFKVNLSAHQADTLSRLLIKIQPTIIERLFVLPPVCNSRSKCRPAAFCHRGRVCV